MRGRVATTFLTHQRVTLDDPLNEMAGIFYCGDNLEILDELRLIPDASVDLIYLDPPFNSRRTYNVVYKDSRAQEVAFKDYWSWDEAAPTFGTFVESSGAPPRLRSVLRGLRDLLIDDDSDLLAYIAMMSPRILALHRVLKPTGSMYLHCDPTASHYLKLVLDAIFGSGRFENEIIWQRTNARSAEDRWPRVHDVILFYSKDDKPRFDSLKVPGDAAKIPHTLITGADGKKYQTYELTAPNLRFGETGKAWRGFQPATMGRCWANPPVVMDEWDQQGLIHWPKKKGAWPRRRAAEPFEPENRLVTVGDVWTDIDRINQAAKERLGYPTQKPLELLRRIITASSRPGDLVLDPFCGCGTTIEACERLGRRWIGIDIARKAVEITEGRFAALKIEKPEVVWAPPDLDAAEALAKRSGTKFEEWARRKIRAVKRRKRDRGIDGEAFFRDASGQVTHALVSVKSGKLNPAMVRELRGTIERERAPIGVLVTMQEPSKEMRREATHAGFLDTASGHIPKLQILTMAQVFAGEGIRAPGVNVTEMPTPSVPTGTSPNKDQLGLTWGPTSLKKPGAKSKPSKPPEAPKSHGAKKREAS